MGGMWREEWRKVNDFPKLGGLMNVEIAKSSDIYRLTRLPSLSGATSPLSAER